MVTGRDVGHDRMLIGVTMAQLACNVAGWAIAVWRRRAYDLGVVRGSPNHVRRDSVLVGTAFSAPVPMLVVQGILIRKLRRHGSNRARGGLRALGTLMVGGYLGEWLVRRRLQPDGFDPVETPIVGLGLVLAMAMAVLGRHR